MDKRFVSLFESARNPVPTTETVLDDLAFAAIQDESLKPAIEAIRSETDKKKRDALKKKLRAVTWSGTFSQRNAESLLQYSGIVCMDIDGLDSETIYNVHSCLSEDPFVYAVFVSPSGNGLKALFLTDNNASQHTATWQSIADYLSKYYNLEADKSGKDVCRLCFLSYDPDIYINKNAKIFDVVPEDQIVYIQEDRPKTTSTDFLQICHDTAVKSYPPAP